MSLWDSSGYGETYTSEGCFVTRYEAGKVVEAWGPYATEQQCENAHRRIRRGLPNRKDNVSHLPGGLPWR